VPAPQRLVIVGSSGHSRSVAEAAESAGFTIESLIDIAGNTGDQSLNSAISELEAYDETSIGFALGMGTNFFRARAYKEILARLPAAHFPGIIHSQAWVSPSALIGHGTVVLAHASVGSRSSVGLGGLVNTGASLDHDSTMNDFASLGPGARTGGNTSIGMRTMVGLQSGILQGRAVGDDTLIGAHSLVTEDIPSLSVAMGTPARVTRTRESDESYY